jgi:hypothetical protein
VLLTRSPVSTTPKGRFVPRLACIKPAASVRPEPGSNSPLRDRRTLDVPIDTKQRRLESRLDVRGRPDDLIPHRLWGTSNSLAFQCHEGISQPTGCAECYLDAVSLAFGTLCSSQGAESRSSRVPPRSARRARPGGRLPVGHRLLRPGRLPSGAKRYQPRFGPCKPGRRRNRLPSGTTTVTRHRRTVNLMAPAGTSHPPIGATMRLRCERSSLRPERLEDRAPVAPTAAGVVAPSAVARSPGR